MKILTTSEYRKLTNLVDVLSDRLESEKGHVSRLLHENKELHIQLEKLTTKRDKAGKFAPKGEPKPKPLAEISAKFFQSGKAKGRAKGSRLALKYLLMEIKYLIEND